MHPMLLAIYRYFFPRRHRVVRLSHPEYLAVHVSAATNSKSALR